MMKNRFQFFLFPVSFCLGVLALSCEKTGTQSGGEEDPDTPATTEVSDKTPGTDFFYKGTTMCFASYLQDAGLVYRENGAVCDPYTSVAAHGATCIRLQLDQLSFSTYESHVIDWQSWDRVLADAKKAKAKGLEIFLTIKPDYDIYSDSSTSHNILPPAWGSLSESGIGSALYDYVYGRLEALAKEEIYPAIVAVGNEVNVGFLRKNSTDAADNARTGRLLVYAHKAVRDYAAKYNPACLNAVHIANPAKAEAAIKAYESAGASDFDVVAVSYYPGKNIGHTLPCRDFATFAKLFTDKKKS